MAHRAIIAVTAVFAFACDTGENPSVDLWSQTRDSAGITIVENQQPPPDSRLAWRVAAKPSVLIGTLDGDEPYQFFEIRGASKLADGRLIVANGSSSELRVFDTVGVYLAAWGGQGEGPGEFTTGLTAVAPWPGDSLAASDGYPFRISIFDSEGNYGRSFRLDDSGGLAVFRGTLPGGMIFARVYSPSTSLAPQEGAGIARADKDLAIFGRDGEVRSSLGRHPGDEGFYRFSEGRGATFDFPFARSTVPVVWGNLVTISPTDRYEIKAYRYDGQLVQIVRRDHNVRSPTQADLDAHLEKMISDLSEQQQSNLRENAPYIPVVESFPAFDNVIADALGYLWVEEYRLPGDQRTVWTVFGPDGRVRGLVETPPELLVLEIGDDYILGKAIDKLGGEYVQLWPLTREG